MHGHGVHTNNKIIYCSYNLISNKVVKSLCTLHIHPQDTAVVSVFCISNPLVDGANCSMKLPQPQFPTVFRLFFTLNCMEVTRVVANIPSRRRQLGELCCESSPWRGSTPFPLKTLMSVVCSVTQDNGRI